MRDNLINQHVGTSALIAQCAPHSNWSICIFAIRILLFFWCTSRRRLFLAHHTVWRLTITFRYFYYDRLLSDTARCLFGMPFVSVSLTRGFCIAWQIQHSHHDIYHHPQLLAIVIVTRGEGTNDRAGMLVPRGCLPFCHFLCICL